MNRSGIVGLSAFESRGTASDPVGAQATPWFRAILKTVGALVDR
jgi:hypothetical protein